LQIVAFSKISNVIPHSQYEQQNVSRNVVKPQLSQANW